MKLTEVKESQFRNGYGSLTLFEGEDVQAYLIMGDPLACKYFGPLTSEQLEAFHTLCTVEEV